jgi:FO synthase
VLRILDDAVAKRRVKELLVLTGERPQVNAGVASRLAALGFGDFVDYVVWVCERALERGLLPHTNLGVLSAADLARLREVTASQGLMLESVSPGLVAHQGSPTKHPAVRLQTIASAGELRIPFTSGILVGIGETLEERVQALEALAEVHAVHGHLQEVILQNFVPHQSYYGREMAEIADAAAREYWRTGVGAGPALDSGVGVPGVDRGDEAVDRRGAAVAAGGWDPGAAESERLVAGAGRGGRDRSGRAVRERRSHLARAFRSRRRRTCASACSRTGMR